MLTQWVNPIKKWTDLTFLQRGHTDGQKGHEKMPNITNYERNANQNYNEAYLTPVRMAIIISAQWWPSGRVTGSFCSEKYGQHIMATLEGLGAGRALGWPRRTQPPLGGTKTLPLRLPWSWTTTPASLGTSGRMILQRAKGS